MGAVASAGPEPPPGWGAGGGHPTRKRRCLRLNPGVWSTWSTRRPGVATTMSARQRKPSTLQSGGHSARPHGPRAGRALLRPPPRGPAQQHLRLLDEALLLLGQRLLPGDQGDAQRRGVRVGVEHLAHLQDTTSPPARGVPGEGLWGSPARGPHTCWASSLVGSTTRARTWHTARCSRACGEEDRGDRWTPPAGPARGLQGGRPRAHLHHGYDEGQGLPAARRGGDTEVPGLVAASAHQEPMGGALQESRDDCRLHWGGEEAPVRLTQGQPSVSTGTGADP